MHFCFRSLFFGSLMLAAGCGLTLDYDPPVDAHVSSMDGGLDAGSCGTCPAGMACLGGACRHPCAAPTDCHFDPMACETCDLAIGGCVAADAVCEGGCGSTCDPAEDRCVARCPAGEACRDGECVAGRACENDGDCSDLMTGPCGGASCEEGLCQDVLPAPCVDVVYECARIDACAECEVIPEPERCEAPEVCDPTSHACIACTPTDLSACAPGQICDPLGNCAACTTDGDCTSAGPGGRCEMGACIECIDGLDCVTRGTGAACVSGTCVDCLTDADCPETGRPVCDDANQCVACRRGADCAPGERCHDGVCRGCLDDTECESWQSCDTGTGRCGPARCGSDGDCPVVPCAGLATCDTGRGRCVYALAGGSRSCSDGVPCTTDACAPTAPDADADGCVFTPVSARCVSDGVTCTVQVCAGEVPGADANGCITRHLDRLCLPRAGATCAVPICVGRASGTGEISGCAEALVPALCPMGTLCDEDGDCAPSGTCPADCVDDDLDCNGRETCVGTDCVQVFDGSGGCTGACGEFCRDDETCARRPSAGGSACAP